jgi:glycosidase
LLILLHGTPIALYGDELGLESKLVNGKTVQPYMQWDSSLACGFTTNASFANLIDTNKKCQSSVHLNTAHGAGDTIFDLFTNLIKLRSKESFLFGKNVILHETNVFAFLRNANGFVSYLVVAHFNTESTDSHLVNFHSLHNVPLNAIVEYHFLSDKTFNNDFAIGKEIKTDRILLKYGEILVLELKP